MNYAKKTNAAKYKGHEIRVVNTWFSGAKLYIDGDCRDATSELFRLDVATPTLSATMETEGKKQLVEVFIIAIASVKIKICVDGEQIAGDEF